MLLCGPRKDGRGKLDGGLMAGGGSTGWLGKGTCRSGDESRTVVSMGFSYVFLPVQRSRSAPLSSVKGVATRGLKPRLL